MTPPEVVLVPVPAVTVIDRAPATPPSATVSVAGATPPSRPSVTPIPPRTGNAGTEWDEPTPAGAVVVVALLVFVGICLVRQFVRGEQVSRIRE